MASDREQHHRVDEAGVVAGNQRARQFFVSAYGHQRRQVFQAFHAKRAAHEEKEYAVHAVADPRRQRLVRHNGQHSPHRRRQQPHHQEKISAINRLHPAPHGARRAMRHACRGQPRHLHPRRRPPNSEPPRKIELLGGIAPQLAARSLGNGAGRNQLHQVGRQAQRSRNFLMNRCDDFLLPRGTALIRFGDHHEPLGPRLRVGGTERHHASLPHTFDASRQLFHLVRIQVAPRLDDDVLGAAGDVILAVHAVRAIARIEPAFRAHHRASGFRVAVVTRGR